MAQAPAVVTIMKRDQGRNPNELAKSVFTDALQEIQVEETVREAMDGMWDLNRALRESIEQIVEEKGSDAMGAVKESLDDFATAVEALVTEAVDEAEDVVADGSGNLTKGEGSKRFFAGDYAYVPDPQKPSTWTLRLTNDPGGDPDPMVVGAAAVALDKGLKGQVVQVPADAVAGVITKVRSAWLKANPGKTKDDLPEVLKKGDGDMSGKKDGDNTPTVESLQEQLTKAEETIAAMDLLLKLTPDARAHHDAMDEADRGDFLKLDADAQAAAVAEADELAKAEDPVVYTDREGVEYRKSDGDKLITLAKRSDADFAKAEEAEAARQETEFTKRAGEELTHLPGETKVKVSLLKAVAAMPAKEREAAEAMLKANNEALESALLKRGTIDGGEDTPKGKLDALAKSYAKEHDCSEGEAMTKVLETEEGKRLYEEIPTGVVRE